MTIADQRFQSLDKITNIPIADLFTANNIGVLNTVIQTGTSALSSLSNLLNSSGVNSVLTAINNATGSNFSVARLTQDISSGVKDLTGMSVSQLSSAVSNTISTVGSTIGNVSAAISNFQQLSTGVQQLVLGTINNPVSLVNSVTNGNATSVIGSITSDINNISGLLNKVSGGNFPTNIVDQNTLNNFSVGLGIAGYAANLPNTFNTIASGISNPQTLLSVGSSLVNNLANQNNTAGMIDILGSNIGKTINAIDPNITNKATGGFSDSTTTPNGITSLYNNFSNALTNANPSWNTMPGTTTPSTGNISNNSNLAKAMTTSAKQSIPSTSNYSTIPTLSKDSINSLVLNMPSQTNTISQLPGIIPLMGIDLSRESLL